jgi:predicted DNA-binding ribbon-helix-helix protein
MMEQGRNRKGKFTSKSDEPRSVRTMRLTESTWKALGEAAEKQSITRADLIEQLVQSEAFLNDVQSTQTDLRSEFLEELQRVTSELLQDQVVTRGSKDKSRVKIAYQALIQKLLYP